jgi:hypothetical protein
MTYDFDDFDFDFGLRPEGGVRNASEASVVLAAVQTLRLAPLALRGSPPRPQSEVEVEFEVAKPIAAISPRGASSAS